MWLKQWYSTLTAHGLNNVVLNGDRTRWYTYMYMGITLRYPNTKGFIYITDLEVDGQNNMNLYDGPNDQFKQVKVNRLRSVSLSTFQAYVTFSPSQIWSEKT